MYLQCQTLSLCMTLFLSCFFIVLHLIENKFCVLWHSFDSILALHLPLGKTTVMHLVARENLPEPNNQGKPVNDISGVNVKYVNIKDKGCVNIANCIFKYQ